VCSSVGCVDDSFIDCPVFHSTSRLILVYIMPLKALKAAVMVRRNTVVKDAALHHLIVTSYGHRDQLHGHFGFELESAVGSNGTRGKEQRGLWRHSSEVKSERRMNDADGDAANVKETCFLAEIIDTGDEDAVGGAGKTSETPVQRNDVAETENPQTGDVEPASHKPSLSSAAFDLMHDASNICRLCGKKVSETLCTKTTHSGGSPTDKMSTSGNEVESARV